MDLFEEAAARRGGIRQAGTRRDINLHLFPQSRDVVKFLVSHGRRLEIRALVKEVLLTGQISERTRQRLKKHGRQTAPVSVKPAEVKAWFPESPFKGKPPPSVLFGGDPESVILAMKRTLLDDAVRAVSPYLSFVSNLDGMAGHKNLGEQRKYPPTRNPPKKTASVWGSPQRKSLSPTP